MMKVRKKKPRRLFRFSLSGILILMAVFSVVLGIWMSLLRPTQVQWNAVRPLMERGVRVATSPSDTPQWIKRFLPEGETENVMALSFRNGGSLQPDDLDCLQYLPHLQRLSIQQCNVTDMDVEQISQHQSLEQMDLWGNMGITNASAQHLVGLKNLQFVDIHSTSVNWRAIKTFSQRPDLKIRWGSRQYFSADESEFDLLAKYFGSEVRWIRVSNGSSHSVKRAMERFPDLTLIEFDRIDLAIAASITEYANAGTKAVDFKISNCDGADDAAWKALSDGFVPRKFQTFYTESGSLHAAHRSRSFFKLLLTNLSPEIVERYASYSILGDIPVCEFRATDFSTAARYAAHFKKAREVQFRNCYPDSFESWPDSPDLRELAFIQCRELKSIELPFSVRWLESLTLSGLDKFTSLETPRSNIATNPTPGLKKLYIHNAPSFANFDSLQQFDSLEDIDISSSSFLTDVSWISGMKNLDSFNVRYCRSLTGVENLNDLPALKELVFHDCESISKIANCNFGSLTKLELSASSEIDSFDYFADVRGLTQLKIKSSHNFTSCKNVERLPSLRTLSLTDLGSLSLDGLQNLPQLEELGVDQSYVEFNKTNESVLKTLAPKLKAFSGSNFLKRTVADMREGL